MKLNIGMDDTDSLKGGCTTFVAYKIVKGINQRFNMLPREYPYLVRLNPNFPKKTKGNGAVKVSYQLEPSIDVQGLIDFVEEVVRRHSHIYEEDTNPAIAFSYGDFSNDKLADFYMRSLCEIIDVQEALGLAQTSGIRIAFLKDSKIGSVGAIAALGADLSGDHTCELLAYRKKEMWGKPRRVDRKSVMLMDERTRPLTFNNLDPVNGRILITPHGPDPVLFGIRGESPSAVLNAVNYLEVDEGIAGWMLFKTNQGTDAHFQAFYERQQPATNWIRSHVVFCHKGKISMTPRTIRGSHVICAVDSPAGQLKVICYRESGSLRRVVASLTKGDEVIVCGGTRKREAEISLNLEKLVILNLVDISVKRRPICPKCGIRCDSKGLRQGYACRRCGFRIADPVIEKKVRKISTGTYLPDPSGQRHLTKPLSRYDLEAPRSTSEALVSDWLR